MNIKLKKKNNESIPVIKLHIIFKSGLRSLTQLDSFLEFFLVWKGFALNCEGNNSVLFLWEKVRDQF